MVSDCAEQGRKQKTENRKQNVKLRNLIDNFIFIFEIFFEGTKI